MPRSVAAAFSTASHSYEKNAHIQRKVVDSFVSDIMTQKLKPKSILELGAGTGILTSQLSSRFHQSKIVATDISLKLLKVLELKYLPSVSTMVLAAEKATHQIAHHDAVISSMMLQWVQNPYQIVSEWLDSMTNDSVLAISYPTDESFPEWKSAQKKSDVEKQGIELPNAEFMMQTLVTKNVEVMVSTQREHMLVASNPLSLLKNMKAVGASHSNQPPISTVKMRQLLSSWPSEQQQFALTYCVHNLIVRKK